MRLILKNFRHHSKLDLVIPDRGLILLKGNSGSGKTTILNAIEFALYGKIKRPYHFGTKTCSVSLETDSLTILRTRTPNRLVVTKDGTRYEDGVAEAVIIDTINLNEDEFYVSSYIRQKSESSLLYMTPAKQMEFLEKVAFQDTKVSAQELKKRCMDLASGLKESAITFKSNYEYGEKRLQDVLIKAGDKPEKVVFDTDEYDQCKNMLSLERKKIDKLVQQQHILEKLEEYTSQSKSLQKKIMNKQKDIDSKLQDIEIPWLKLSRNQATKKLEELKSQKQKIQAQHDAVSRLKHLRQSLDTKTSENVTKVSSIKRKLEDTVDRTDDLKRIKLDISEAGKNNDRYLQRKDILTKLEKIGCSSDIEKELSDIDKQIKRWETKKATYEEQLGKYQLQQQLQACPECQASLRFVDGKLEPADTDHSHIKDPSSKIKRIIKAIKEISDKRSEIQKWSSYAELLEQDISYIPVEPLEETFTKYDDEQTRRGSLIKQLDLVTKSFEKEHTKLQQDIVESEKSLSPSLSIDLQDIESEIEVMSDYITASSNNEKEITRLTNDRKCEDWISEREKLEKKIASLPDVTGLETKTSDIVETTRNHIVELDNELVCLEEKRIQAEQYSRYREYRLEIIQLRKEVKEAKRKYDKVLLKQEAYAVLKDKIKNAESVALEQATDSINEHASHFLRMMFTEDPVHVTLQTSKITKTTQKQKAEINTSIHFRGHQYESIDQISGGEQDRISLAFVLALNKLFNSRMLLLDECIASLDASLNADIIDHLHDFSRNKLVLVVSHEANPSLFDEVIKIG